MLNFKTTLKMLNQDINKALNRLVILQKLRKIHLVSQKRVQDAQQDVDAACWEANTFSSNY